MMISINNTNINILAGNHYNYIKQHFDNKKSGYEYSTIDQWFKTNGLGLSFKEVILADMKDLPKIKNAYHESNYPKEIKFIRNQLYTNNFSKSSGYLKGGHYNAAKLVLDLGIIVCPYCNRNYINNAESSIKGVKRTSQLDHFYSSSKYPFLAMSFFNLIPSCSGCNLFKSHEMVYYSPYNTKFTPNELFNFKLEAKSLVDPNDLSNINLELVNIHKRIHGNINIFRLESQYRVHRDLVQDLIIRSKMYTPERINELKKDFSKLNLHENDFNRIMYGNYLEEENFHKRPLSKLTSDIIKELKSLSRK